MKAKRIIKTCMPIVVLLGLIGIYIGLLTLVYVLPQGSLKENYAAAKGLLAIEGDYPVYLFQADGALLDNYTDGQMLDRTLSFEDNTPLFNALIMQWYARYWHGYTLWLKPLLSIMNYVTIRRIIMVIFYGLFLAALLLLQKRFGAKMSIPFAVTFVAFYSASAAGSMQYFSSYFFMYLAVILVTCLYKKETKWGFLLYFFLMVGSLVNFFDFLTFPLVTLTMPLSIILIVDLYEKKKSAVEAAWNTVRCALVWLFSYAITWASKWVLTQWIFKSKVIENALSTAKFRVGGDENTKIDRIKVLVSNIKTPLFLREILWISVPLLILLIVHSIIRKWEKISSLWTVFVVAVMPYIWYEVLCNHSQQHRWFVNKAQMGTMFIILVAVIYGIAFMVEKTKEEKIAEAPCEKETN